ncbi:MAG: DoxX family membrane protein [Thiothrix sp.]|nr:DoxX family membrane protein [Thiothrix sp.]HPE59602.1 DoxX family membrane protein [Thiolinea sp.]
MNFLVGFFSFKWLRTLDFLAPLAIRFFMAPVLWVAGVRHLGLFSGESFSWLDVSSWWNHAAFEASAAGLSHSLVSGIGSETLLLLIGGIEIGAALLLVFGFAVRWVTLAVLAVMLLLGLMSGGGLLQQAQTFVHEHGFVHGVTETPVMYFILLLALFFMGAGRWFSLDWYIYRRFVRNLENQDDVYYHATHDPFEIDATDEPGVGKARVRAAR